MSLQTDKQNLWDTRNNALPCDIVIKTPKDIYNLSPGHSNGLQLDIINRTENVLELAIRNNQSEAFRINGINIDLPLESFAQSPRADRCRQLIHHIDFFPHSGVKPMHISTPWSQPDSSSSIYTVISDDLTGEAILLGALPPYSKGFTWIDILYSEPHKAGRFGLRIRMDFRCDLPAGKTLKLSPLVLLAGQSGEELMGLYEQMTAERIELKRKTNIIGWSSWDYYAGAVLRNDMDENRKACQAKFPGLISHMIIDDGYQRIWGDWATNWKFSEGLNDYCKAVEADGYTPGVWIAPLMVSVNSPLYRQRPEWLLDGEDGNVYQFSSGSWGNMGQLDPTHHEVKEHLRKVFAELKLAGFKYFKVDFTQLLMEAKNYHDPTVGRAGVVRELFKLIRESIGDSYLLSCGAPFESVLGVVDSVRSSGDIHNYDTMTVQCSRNTFSRLWMQRVACNIDGDFLIVRADQTSDERHQSRRSPVLPVQDGIHWCDGPEFGIDGARFWALATYLTGGDIVLGDRIAVLNKMGTELIEKVLKTPRVTGRWINQFHLNGQDYPVILAEQEDHYVLGVFNMSDEIYSGAIPAELPFDISTATDFWTGEPVDCEKLSLAPSCAVAVCISKK